MKTITSRWPTGIRAGADFVMAVMKEGGGPLLRKRPPPSCPAGEAVISPNARASFASPEENPFSYPYFMASKAPFAAAFLAARISFASSGPGAGEAGRGGAAPDGNESAAQPHLHGSVPVHRFAVGAHLRRSDRPHETRQTLHAAVARDDPQLDLGLPQARVFRHDPVMVGQWRL